ncbi:hypothetical protein DNTS_018869 [Danionella cerebrum]|uniref:Uncharacterized protein n=1 Tax=Danionella cerebrum TaxID=2873325 RepID=A0A553QET5_9TELE|nr:hypothetical protein DNTS_018869 [Danionella translucida]
MQMLRRSVQQRETNYYEPKHEALRATIVQLKQQELINPRAFFSSVSSVLHALALELKSTDNLQRVRELLKASCHNVDTGVSDGFPSTRYHQQHHKHHPCEKSRVPETSAPAAVTQLSLFLVELNMQSFRISLNCSRRLDSLTLLSEKVTENLRDEHRFSDSQLLIVPLTHFAHLHVLKFVLVLCVSHFSVRNTEGAEAYGRAMRGCSINGGLKESGAVSAAPVPFEMEEFEFGL